MARVVHSTNPYQPVEHARVWSARGRFIDFLEAQFPDGFPNAYVVFRKDGREQVELDDFDFTMVEGETVVILEMPGYANIGALILKAAVSALISFAITFIVNLLFPPPSPGAGGAPSPVYSFQARQNQARLGEPIPTIYGRMITYPNIVSQPYYRYEGNNQFLYMLLGIGHGWHTLHRVLIENDSVATLPAGTVTTWLFNPDQHQRKIGVIEAATGVWEDVVTSPQVAGQRLENAGAVDTWYIGWFNTNPEGTDTDLVEFDFVFPSGIANQNRDGSLDGWQVDILMELQSIDELGNPVGAVTSRVQRYTGRTRTPQRFTYAWAVEPGRYRTRIRRLSAATRTSALEVVQAIGLRARLRRTGQAAYGDTTLLAVKIKANEAISSEAQRRIRAEVTRRCRTWRQPGLVASANPADHVYDIMVDKVNGAGRPADEVDTATLQQLWSMWSSQSGFNGQFDQRGTIIQGLTAVTAPVRGRPIALGSVISVIADGPQPLRATVFTPENMVADTFSIRYAFRQDEPYDGYEVEFFDAKDFTQDVRIWPKDSVRPQTVPLLGCTDPVQAEAYARLLWQQDLLLRKQVTFETELEGLIYTLGARFGVAHPMPNWGASARVEGVDGPTNRILILDQTIPAVTNPYAFLRSETGGVSAPIACTMQDDPDYGVTVLTLKANPPFEVFGRGSQEPTFVAIGSGTDFVQDFTFTDIEPLQQGTVRITGILYDERVWEGV